MWNHVAQGGRLVEAPALAERPLQAGAERPAGAQDQVVLGRDPEAQTERGKLSTLCFGGGLFACSRCKVK